MASPSPNLRFIANEDGAVILDIEHDLISTLNPTGAYVWKRLQCGESIESIIAALVHDTGEAHCRVDRDVHDFVEALKQKRLLSS